MRAVESIWYRNFLTHLGMTKGRYGQSLEQSTTGKKLNHLSDGPADMAYALSLRNKLDQSEQYQQNIGSGKSLLSASESALNSVLTRMYQVITLAEQGASDTSEGEGREVLATQVEAVRDALLDLGNTEVLGRFLFSGSASDTTPFVKQADTSETLPDGRVITVPGDVVYQGNSDVVQIQADFSLKVDVGIPGDQAFGIGEGRIDIFAHLQKMVRDLRADDTTALGQDISIMHEVVGQLNDVIGVCGNGTAQLNEVLGQLKQFDGAVKSNLSQLEDANMAEALSDLKQEEVALQALFQTGARIGNQSLLDYIG